MIKKIQNDAGVRIQFKPGVETVLNIHTTFGPWAHDFSDTVCLHLHAQQFVWVPDGTFCEVLSLT